jgi:glycosyltransferase involved in cell wall biosynthesis
VVLVHVTTVPMTLLALRGQLSFMEKAGFEVHVISSPGVELDKFALEEGVAPHSISMSRRIAPLRDVVSLIKLWRLLRAMRPEIVDAHTPKAGLLGMLAAWLAGVPVRIHHLHGLLFPTRTGLSRWLIRWFQKLSCLFAHRVISVSQSMREVMIAERVCPPGKIRVLLNGSINGVDANGRFRPASDDGAMRKATRASFGISDSALVLGFIGRVVRDKGVVELATAWQSLRTEFSDLHLLIVGPFESSDPVPSETKVALESDSRIHLLGLDRDTPRLYSAMDLLILPSYREGFPLVAIEAASMALPVVTTRVTGCVDAVRDGVTGKLVPARDDRSLTDAIRSYLRDPALRRRHGAVARAWVLQELSQEAIWSATRDEYRDLLKDRGVSLERPRR